ncbi:hypothetical protein P7D22_17400 [Lichenihabitans sp. Uapishka_5]|uniref:hypothetical protein n=1 Tax=Lichenihabitans sp. Uapishka_5 TaxID=3037302 RepID=UPI0029E7D27B|nr:hypothetical protein [Lichenihabitans sp. Uapishka_5]MDX7952943.1 hypothetical protein [Lichenihabitans sp. Uapishka_5]
MTPSKTTTLPQAADTILKATATYAEAYATLSSIAERLRATGSTASIDRLAADLRAARSAHAVCRDRLAAIRAEIDQEVAAAQVDEAVA